MVALRRFLKMALPLAILLSCACSAYGQEASADQAKVLLEKGIAQYNSFDFTSAQASLLKVDRSKLADPDKKTLDDYLTKVNPAIKGNAEAMEAFKSAEAALKANDLNKARDGFAKAAGSKYLADPMKKDATAQLALVDNKIKLAAAAKPAPTPTPTPAKPAVVKPVAVVAPVAPVPVPAAPVVVPVKPAVTVVAPPVGGEPAILTRLGQANRVSHDQAMVDYNKAMARSSELANAAKSDSDFAAASDAARVAQNVLDANKMYFTADEYKNLMTRATDQVTWVEQQKTRWEATQVQRQRAEIEQVKREQEIRALQDRKIKIDQLTATADRLYKERDFERALEITDQIRTLDPANCWANRCYNLLQNNMMLKKEGEANNTRAFETQKQMVDLRESEIPWYNIINYPRDWRALTANRDRFGPSATGETDIDRIVNEKLRKKINKLDFADIPFDGVIQFMREISNANIDVNWTALTSAGIDRATSKVTVHLTDVTFDKALRVILSGLGTGNLSYMVNDGVITISTKEDLNLHTQVRVYDISDLIIRVPNFTAPRLDLNSSGNQSGNNGGGGGGSIFGDTNSSSGGQNGGSNNQGEDNFPKKSEIITGLIASITETVDPTSWKVNGGTVGAMKEVNSRLVVTQTADNQAAIVNLLAQLREMQSLQIAIEARFISVSSGFLETIGLNLDVFFNIGSSLGGNVIRDPATGAIVGPKDPWTGAIVPNNSSPSGWGPDPDSSGTNNHWTPIPIIQNHRTFANMIGRGTGIGAEVTAPAISSSGTFLDDVQVNYLIEATQADSRTRTLTAPRVTIFNTQRAYVTVGTMQAYVSEFEPVVSDNAVALRPTIAFVPTGSLLDVEGTVSADRRYVTLTVRPQVSVLNSLTSLSFGAGPTAGTIQLPNVTIQQLETTVYVPDGGTLLVGGQKLASQLEREEGVPILSKVPVINRLFTNRGMQRDEQTLLILIKPKIIIPLEEETRAFPPGNI